MVKEKLTLSVDQEVVEKAKKLGINISDITERVLKGYTSAEKPNGSLYEGYKQLFDSITPLLNEFGADMKIAEQGEVVRDGKGNTWTESCPIFLEGDGSFYNDLFDESFLDIKKISLNAFLSPEKILSNLLDALAKSNEIRKEKMKEILMAKRIVDAMSETLIRRNLSETKPGAKEKRKS